ncbi:hypothetical protein [Thalassotalea profundi]|uniref:Uncharacterized protein n=1 Tax=Thalassotalea profundi TaxID=2036687 RepID=A0ABQ3IYD5_9GAMM|nr:hypothetical protein [Thalassotalea profundi]GHE96721.1 hypothetical protein GCM10011501_27770 [Thalassotalea profundi]
MSTNTAAFTPEIIEKIARYRDEKEGLGRPPRGGYFVTNKSIVFFEGSKDNVIIETLFTGFYDNEYYTADMIPGEDVPESFDAISVETLDKF